MDLVIPNIETIKHRYLPGVYFVDHLVRLHEFSTKNLIDEIGKTYACVGYISSDLVSQTGLKEQFSTAFLGGELLFVGVSMARGDAEGVVFDLYYRIPQVELISVDENGHRDYEAEIYLAYSAIRVVPTAEVEECFRAKGWLVDGDGKTVEDIINEINSHRIWKKEE